MTGRKKFEPPILAELEELYAQNRKKIKPVYPYDQKTNTISLPKEIVTELKLLLLAGNRAAAVKRVSEHTGASLRVSKDFVDDLLKV